MADRRYDWGFYGRKKELDELRKWLISPDFNTVSVVGGRGVGKTELIKEAVKSLNGRKPFIYLELPGIHRGEDGGNPQAERIFVNNALADLAGAEGLADALPAPPSPEGLSDQLGYFRRLLDCMLRHGAVVALDEFQNARELDLVSYVKMVIDTLKYERNTAGGKVVVAGSHQQKILRMLFSAAEPMYGRIDGSLRLFPLAAPEVLDMAAAQGWLGRPHRFLTAYTAFGGSPYRWRRLFDEQKTDLAPEPSDGEDRTWRSEFVAREVARYRNDPDEGFFNAAYMNLSAEARDVAIELARNPGGVRWSRVVERYGGAADGAEDRAQRGFDILCRHLGIAEFVPESGLFSKAVRKVRLTDQAALFELNMEKSWPQPIPAGIGQHEDPALYKVNEMEGIALERLTAEWLGSFKLFEFVQRSAEMRLPDNRQLEIDVIGETLYPQQGKRYIALCSCKRNPGRHELQKSHDDFDLYLQMRAKNGNEFDGERVRRFLVSPEWPPSAFRNDGFERFDFAEMAGSKGCEIKPWPVRKTPEPVTEDIQLQPASRSQSQLTKNRAESDGSKFDM